MAAKPWTQEKIMLLETLVSRGFNSSEIINRPEFYGHSRNSIIGMCHRQGFKLAFKARPLEKTPPKPKKMPKEKKPAPRKLIVFPKIEKKNIEEPPVRTSLLAAREGKCRYIVGGISPDGSAYVCGLPLGRGNWCEAHANICYQHEKAQ